MMEKFKSEVDEQIRRIGQKIKTAEERHPIETPSKAVLQRALPKQLWSAQYTEIKKWYKNEWDQPQTDAMVDWNYARNSYIREHLKVQIVTLSAAQDKVDFCKELAAKLDVLEAEAEAQMKEPPPIQLDTSNESQDDPENTLCKTIDEQLGKIPSPRPLLLLSIVAAIAFSLPLCMFITPFIGGLWPLFLVVVILCMAGVSIGCRRYFEWKYLTSLRISQTNLLQLYYDNFVRYQERKQLDRRLEVIKTLKEYLGEHITSALPPNHKLSQDQTMHKKDSSL